MDAWWESLDRAFAAWTQAIEQSQLAWKYRQVEQGEWNLFQTPEQAMAADALLDAPLPWDHIDSGIDKAWLKADLQRALEAATVPDCSFDGCSHCGVCGADFGHNVVVSPPPIPAFAGHFVPNQTRCQRLRVWFGKQGDMALLSHLDLLRLFDRAVRRAALPIAFTGGFHPSPRIVPANALPLGVTSSGEIVDFDLTQPIAVSEFWQQLAAQLPAQIPIYRVEVIPADAPAATQQLQKAEYCLLVQATSSAPSREQWQAWITAILAATEIGMEQTTKSGKSQRINLRDRLYELQSVEPEAIPAILKPSMPPLDSVMGLRYVGSCRNDGTLLRPEHVLYMLEAIAHQEFQLLQVHRQQLILES